VEKLYASHEVINFIIGCVFSITSIFQIWKILKKKDAVEVLHDQPEEIIP